jgi:hypothetical protein
VVRRSEYPESNCPTPLLAGGMARLGSLPVIPEPGGNVGTGGTVKKEYFQVVFS